MNMIPLVNLVQVESCSKVLVALQNSCPSWRSCWSFGHSNHSSLPPLLFRSATSALLWRPQQKRAADLDSAGVTWTSSEEEQQPTHKLANSISSGFVILGLQQIYFRIHN